MKKSEPKMILNLSIENNKLEEKVKIAVDEYVEDLIIKNLDDAIARLVERRIDNLLTGSRYSSNSKINGKSFSEFVKDKTEKQIEEVIDKNIKIIFARKVAEML